MIGYKIASYARRIVDKRLEELEHDLLSNSVK